MVKDVRNLGILGIVVMTLVSVIATDVEAARLGGGRSMGAQRPSVAPRASAPPAATAPGAASQPVMPAQPGASLPAKPAAAAATPAAAGASRWLGPIAGLAAGLGLAALLSHFGLPEGLGSFLLIALLVVAGVFVARMLLARRNQPQRPLAYAGAPGASSRIDAPPVQSVGGAPRIEPVLGTTPAGAATANALPPGFDAQGFAAQAKLQFVRLQAAHDAADRKMLADYTTPEMFAELARDLDGGAARSATEIVTLQAEVLEAATEARRHWASIRFTGTLREGGATTPTAFDEVWNLTKPVDGSSGWLLAGIQQTA